ncbi:hypothetical protein ACF0H5_013723 [Mactra antiquata]
MGNGNVKTERTRSFIRLIPREPMQEKFHLPEVEPGYPPIRYPSTSKKDIYNPKDNRDIYFYALNAPKDIENSWDDLVHYLTSIYRTDMMKIRSIFSWLGVQEIEKESFFMVSTPNDIDEITPRGYKKVIKEREGSYATFFALICRKAGIKCALINGLSKGFGYNVGDSEVTHLKDRWNAVYVDGWRLIHPLWAFKNVISHKRGKWIPANEKMKLTDVAREVNIADVDHDFNEYYFLVDPAEFLNVCIPDNRAWQMTKPILTVEKWSNRPYVMKRYHMEGFKIPSEFKSTLKSKKGVCGLVINAPSKKDVEYQLSYDFFFNYAEYSSESDDIIVLKKYVLLSRDCARKSWSIEARMPLAGTYRITVYGGKSYQAKLPWICDVGVQCKKTYKHIKPYPDTPALGFGPMDMTERAGLTQPSHTNGMLFVRPRQTYHLTFKLQHGIQAKAIIKGENVDTENMDKWVTCTINNQSTLHILDIMVQLQIEGEYALKLFVKEKNARPEDKWENVCNYYLSTDPPRANGTEVKDKEYKTAKELNARKALEEASKGKDLYELKAAVSKFKDQGLYEEDGSFGKATLKMEYLELSKALKDAINRRNYEVLTSAIDRAEKSDHAQRLQNLIDQAKAERDKLEGDNKYMHAVLEMKQSTISEMTSYQKPPETVYATLKATLILLGEDPRSVEEWNSIQARFRKTGSEGVLRRVRNFDLKNINQDTIDHVGDIVSNYEEKTVLAASAGAATFFKWVN